MRSGWLCVVLAAATAVRADLYPPLKLLWQHQAKDGFYATPTVVGDTVFAGSLDGNVYALEANTGRVRWSLTAGGQVYSGVVVAGGTGYVGTSEGNVIAFDPASGAERRRHRIDGTIYATPALADRLVLVGTGDTGIVYALDADTLEERWTFPLGKRMGSGLAVQRGVAYIGSYDGHLYAVELPSGRLRWQYVADQIIDSQPLATDEAIYIKLPDDRVIALHPATGKPLWEKAGVEREVTGEPSNWSPLARAGGLLLFGSPDGRIHALDATSGAERWQSAAGAEKPAPPAVVGELGWLGAKDGSVSAISLETGETLWEWRPAGTVKPALISGVMWPPAVVGSRLYVASLDGNLYAFEGNADGGAWRRAREATAALRRRLQPALGEGVQPSDAELAQLAALPGRVNGIVVWESNRDGAWDLFRIGTDGAGFAKITRFAERRDALAYNGYLRPRVSPDGRTVLFAYGRKNAPVEAWVVGIDGGEPRKLTIGAPLNWAPDGRAFFFVRDSRLWRHLVADGRDEPVNDVALPVDGREGGMVGGVHPDLTSAVFRSPRSNEYFSFARAETVKTMGGCEPQFTFDGRYLYWVNGPRDFKVWDSQTDTERQFLGRPPVEPYNYTYFPTVTPDRRWVAYGASPSQHDHNTSDYEVYLQELRDWQPEGEPVRLTWHPRTDRWPYLWVKP